jgi:hypothetical protein
MTRDLQPLVMLQPTRQEKASGLLLAAILLLGSLTLLMAVVWLMQQRRHEQRPVAVIHVPRDRERASGAPGESETAKTLEEPGTDDQTPLPAEHAADNLTTVSSLVSSELLSLDSLGGSPKGIGVNGEIGDSRHKGPSGPDGNLIPDWERWQIRFSAADVNAYAAMLDYFQVELGVIGGGHPKVDYARNLSNSRPTTRQGAPAAERRLRFVFQMGELRDADRALAERAGLSTEGRVVCQFYPAAVQSELVRLERQALGTRALASVRRTVFGVRQTSDGYQFFVERTEPEHPVSGISPL